MGTQTEIAKKITEKGADYILTLKENQKTLYEDVRLFFEEYQTNQVGLDPDCCATTHSQGHGRYETRTCYLCKDTHLFCKAQIVQRQSLKGVQVQHIPVALPHQQAKPPAVFNYITLAAGQLKKTNATLLERFSKNAFSQARSDNIHL